MREDYLDNPSGNEHSAPQCPWALAARTRPSGVAILEADGSAVSWAELHAWIEAVRPHIEAFEEQTVAIVTANRTSDIVRLVAALRSGKDVALFGPRTPSPLVEEEASRLNAPILDDFDVPVLHLAASPTTGSVPHIGGGTLIRTSGSTGEARWIRHDSGAHLNSAAAAIGRLGLNAHDRWGWCLPMYHVGGLSILWRCALQGASLVCQPDGTPVSEWLSGSSPDSVPTHLSMVPTQLRDLLAAEMTPPSAVRSVIVGGALLPKAVLSQAIQAGWPVRTTYGMTETASMVTLSGIWVDAAEEAIHAGTPLPDVEIEARDGRIHVRTPSLGDGLADEDGWYRTSDRGRLDSAGRWIISGRLDRVIISGGENLDPDRIERTVRELDSVDECVVVAVPDARYGQRPVAFVVCSAGMLSYDDFAAKLQGSLASFEIPDAFFELPPLAAGQTKWSRSELETSAKSLQEAGQDGKS